MLAISNLLVDGVEGRLLSWLAAKVGVRTARLLAAAVVVAILGVVGAAVLDRVLTRPDMSCPSHAVTMRWNAIDASDRPSPKQAAHCGVAFVATYLGHFTKGSDREEQARFHAGGIGTLANWEGWGCEMVGCHGGVGGAAQGMIDGTKAREAARVAGFPTGTPIYYSIDFDVTAAQMPAVLAYLKAADSRDYPARAYGDFAVCAAWKRACWQTYAWSAGRWSGYSVFRQVLNDQNLGGHIVDLDLVVDRSKLGAWQT